MSSPIKSLIQALVLKGDIMLAEALPQEPGNLATPNTLRRQYYRTKKQLEDLNSLLSRIEKAENDAREDLSKSRVDQRDAKEAAYTTWINNLKLSDKVNDLLQKTQVWRERIEKLEERLDIVDDGSSSTVTASSDTTVRRMARPQIKLRSFSGPIEEWLPFWETFRAIVHEDTVMSKIEKFNLLESNLIGLASEFIAGIPITEDGYDNAIDLLLKKFGDDNKLIRALNQELINLPESSSFDEDEALYLKIEKICRQLENLKQNVNSAPYFMTLEGKMSAQILDKYFSIKDAEDKNDWDTQKFRDAFERAIMQVRNRREAKSTNYNGKHGVKEEPSMSFAVKFDEQKRGRVSPPPNQSPKVVLITKVELYLVRRVLLLHCVCVCYGMNENKITVWLLWTTSSYLIDGCEKRRDFLRTSNSPGGFLLIEPQTALLLMID